MSSEVLATQTKLTALAKKVSDDELHLQQLTDAKQAAVTGMITWHGIASLGPPTNPESPCAITILLWVLLGKLLRCIDCEIHKQNSCDPISRPTRP